jgi:endonuclease YncB( thermonuclease family)
MMRHTAWLVAGVTQSRESIDERLVWEGLALAWTRDGQHRDLLVVAEEGAKRDGRGCLW